MDCPNIVETKETPWGGFVRCRLIEEGAGLRPLVSPRRFCVSCPRSDEGKMRDVVNLYLRDRIRRRWRQAFPVSVEEAAQRLAERLGKEELRRTLVQAVEAGMPAAEAMRHAAANGVEAVS